MTETCPATASDLVVPDRRIPMVLGLLALLLPGVILLSVGIGAVGIAPQQVVAILAGKLGLQTELAFDLRQEHVLLAIRLPRVVMGLFIGAALAVGGAMMQGLFRNPLADPSLIGTSSGAALGAIAVIVLGAPLGTVAGSFAGTLLLPVAAFLGGLGVTLLVYRIALSGRQMMLSSMLLAGIAINALAGAVIGGLLYVATDAQLRTVTFWNMGSLGGASWEIVMIVAPLLSIVLLVAPRLSRGLNALLLGEAEAGHLGIDAEGLKRRAIVLSALAVGVSVAFSGVIGFVGLVAPHVVRLVLGPDHNGVIPASALLGAALLVGADLVARTVVTPSELPLGIVTALFGAPLFLWLLIRDRTATARFS